MKRGRFNVVTDGQWGSCGKGKVSTALCLRHRPEAVTTTNMANAGHTAQFADGTKFVGKALPCPAFLHSKPDLDYRPHVFVGATAAFFLDQLLDEVKQCNLLSAHLCIHPRAGVITQAHREAEAGLGVRFRDEGHDTSRSTAHIASTMQGCGAFLADKVLRRPELKLAMHYAGLAPYVLGGFLGGVNEPSLTQAFPLVLQWLRTDCITVLHEGAQGFSLDISHGSHYPHCTSRGTTALQNVADMGVPAGYMGDVYLVIRPFPIRVGSIPAGSSGGCYPDQQETTWEEVARNAGLDPAAVKAAELTTVTKRLRRVFTFSKTQVQAAAWVNGATGIVLTFADQIDAKARDAKTYNELPSRVREFVRAVEYATDVPVVGVSTGPLVEEMVWRDSQG